MVAFILHPKGAFVKTVRLFCTGGKPAAHTVCKRKQIVYARTLRRKVKTKAFLGRANTQKRSFAPLVQAKNFSKAENCRKRAVKARGKFQFGIDFCVRFVL